ncbi:secreted protein, putative, partial [Ixodes scapularis]
MNTFIVVLVSSLVLTTFGVFADSDVSFLLSFAVEFGIYTSPTICIRDQCCLETFSGDMVLVTCSPLARPGAPCSNLTEGDEPYKDGCPCIPGMECINDVCTTVPDQCNKKH